VAGLWLLGQEIGLITISIWALWPLVLVLVGGTIIWRAFSPPTCCPPGVRPDAGRKSWTTTPTPASGGETAPSGGPAPERPAVGGSQSGGGSVIHGFAMLGAQERSAGSAEFRGADLVAFMGACKLDLRRATMVGDEAVIDVLALMGGVDILIPETWTVDSRVLPLMGGVGDHTHPIAGGRPQRLVIRGLALMGGVEVKN